MSVVVAPDVRVPSDVRVVRVAQRLNGRVCIACVAGETPNGLVDGDHDLATESNLTRESDKPRRQKFPLEGVGVHDTIPVQAVHPGVVRLDVARPPSRIVW